MSSLEIHLYHFLYKSAQKKGTSIFFILYMIESNQARQVCNSMRKKNIYLKKYIIPE